MNDATTPDITDIFVIGGGVNGAGIARDAAGRGLSVKLAEMNDLASATSSASTKLFHGGLRYLEYFEINLVRHALAEREVLLSAMPHISWPMRFVLPYHPDMRFEGETPTSKILNTVMPWMKGRRPAWLIRMGLFMYDNLGGRKILPATRTLRLRGTQEGAPLEDRFEKAFEYSDCWIEDSRLVVLNARDAERLGARIMTQTKVLSAARIDDVWEITTEGPTGPETHRARILVNAGGPWVGDIIQTKVRVNSTEGVRLVRGSHIVTKRLFDHEKCYFFQGEDGRIIFAIPYETDFTLIGTTDAEHTDLDRKPVCTPEERDYLVNFANQYFKQDISADDVVWTYSGVRPLYDDGAKSATAATRDYVLSVDDTGAPLLNIFGGKITTYRKLAEDAMDKLAPFIKGLKPHWTAGQPLPGGDFAVADVGKLIDELQRDFPFLSPRWAQRLIRAYGTDARIILGDATTEGDLGQNFGADLTAAEIRYLMAHEYASSAEDILWRRSKLGLRLDKDATDAIDSFIQQTSEAA
ncbi:glycerol-3-phosphate dehydrogenase [Sulfitobacter sp. S190]|uniref:glycerol-3-phosphate dehydrogenase n=1 Tax=Sulfitobacter sp. S190 TaxID=2867022 RepID=UPI0021A5E5DE|nr:glycerol-3-phosphate dehydrogenase [Sulfitobacter sp. S190]UWR24509.1 glycerol-3-phosphate dehydrogenase [Sulfitobacter sp. S190]